MPSAPSRTNPTASPRSSSSSSEKRGGARLKGKAPQRRFEWLLLPLGIVASAALGWGTLRALHGTHGYTFWREKVQHDHDRLAALQGQLEDQQHLLTTLKGPNGRDIVLHKQGFVRPGERILLFPDPKPAATNSRPENS